MSAKAVELLQQRVRGLWKVGCAEEQEGGTKMVILIKIAVFENREV